MKSKAVEPAEALQTTEQINRSVLNQQAQQADEIEHQESLRVAIRKHSKAIFWAMMMSMCVIMEGYDTALLGNFFAYPSFSKKFGSLDASTKNYQVPARWQAGLGEASLVGAFLGGVMNGVLVNHFGLKRVVVASLVLLSAFLFIVFFSSNVQVLLVGELLCGFPWGIFATSSPTYASEVLPLSLRIYMTSWTNMCFVIGQLLASGVLAGLVDVPNEWSYRVPFAIQWFWPAVLFPILLFAPESPWYLVRKGRLQEARKALVRLNQSAEPEEIDATLALIIHTDNQEKEQFKVKTSYWQCFRGVELRRTEIACMSILGQVTVGPWFASQSTYFFQQVGLTPNQTYRLNLGSNALGLVAAILSWVFLLPNFGRRTIYIWSTVVMTTILFIVAILNVKTEEHSVGRTQAALLVVWNCLFQGSVALIGWGLPAKVGSTRLRQKTVVIARNVYYIGSVVATVLEPYFINPTAWNAKGYTGFFWGGTSALTLLWAYFRLPETKGRSFEELNLLFHQRVPARRFKHYEVDVFSVKEDEKGKVVHVEDRDHV